MLEANSPIEHLTVEVRRLLRIDARHKRGPRLSEFSTSYVLLHAIEELTEVGRATSAEEAISEMGDALVCLIRFAESSGFSLQDAARSAMAKLPADFPGSGEPSA